MTECQDSGMYRTWLEAATRGGVVSDAPAAITEDNANNVVCRDNSQAMNMAHVRTRLTGTDGND